ncbi:MAG: CoA ester lyase [Thaumarchaeota archaeon]|nr:CoA ester lyase [Nitrososphaerota archaeon]
MSAPPKLDLARRRNLRRRSQLYVPGNEEKMILKAATLEEDSVILDLEDAVPAGEKEVARAIIKRLSNEIDWGGRELCVRVNPVGSPEHVRDISLVNRLGAVHTVLVPKAEGDCSSVNKKSGKLIMPIVETAKGLMMLDAAVESSGITAITFGAADYANSVGGSIDSYIGNQTIRTLLVAAARSFGIEAIDDVFFDLQDLEGFRRQASEARSLGFSGKQVIHPSQIQMANLVFSPSNKEVRWAEKVVREFRRASKEKRGAIRVNGKLVDAVHYRLATGIINRSTRDGS